MISGGGSKILEAHEITIILTIGGIVPRDPPWGLFKPRLSRARGHALRIIGPCYGGVHRGNIFRVGEPRFIVETWKEVEIFLWCRLFFSFFFLREFLRPPLFPRRGGFVLRECGNFERWFSEHQPFSLEFLKCVMFIVGILGVLGLMRLKWNCFEMCDSVCVCV